MLNTLIKKIKGHNQDIIDINYMIDHVNDIDARIDVLKKLGYTIGVNVIKTDKDDIVKSTIIGKRGELRIQVSPKMNGVPLAYCVIL